MITKEELNKHKYPTTPEIDENLSILLDRLNAVRAAFGQPMSVTSGLRDMAKQEQLVNLGRSNAVHSKHLYGQAADIYDPEQKLQAWCMKNIWRLEEIGLWCEAFQATPNWVHFQTIPPSSGTRFFVP